MGQTFSDDQYYYPQITVSFLFANHNISLGNFKVTGNSEDLQYFFTNTLGK